MATSRKERLQLVVQLRLIILGLCGKKCLPIPIGVNHARETKGTTSTDRVCVSKRHSKLLAQNDHLSEN
jgi:hypothetical protein